MVSSSHRYLSASFLTSNRQVGCKFNLCLAVLLNNLLCFWILSDGLDLFCAIFWKPCLFVSHHNQKPYGRDIILILHSCILCQSISLLTFHASDPSGITINVRSRVIICQGKKGYQCLPFYLQDFGRNWWRKGLSNFHSLVVEGRSTVTLSCLNPCVVQKVYSLLLKLAEKFGTPFLSVC